MEKYGIKFMTVDHLLKYFLEHENKEEDFDPSPVGPFHVYELAKFFLGKNPNGCFFINHVKSIKSKLKRTIFSDNFSILII